MDKNEKENNADVSRNPGQPEDEIVSYINGLTFKKRFFGGVDDADVWKKIRELNALYEKRLILERSAKEKSDRGPEDGNE